MPYGRSWGALVAKYGAFKYSEEPYGTISPGQAANLRWTFIVAWDGTYTGENEASRMVDLSVRRGRQHQIGSAGGPETFAVGRAIGEFDNSDGRYDPWNTSSPLYPNVRPGKFVRIAVKDDDGGVNYQVMRGVIDDILLIKRGKDQVARIVVSDGFSWLAGKTINRGLTQDVQKYTNVIRVRDKADWPDVEWGSDITVDTTNHAYWWAWNQNALKALHEFNQAEWAVAFCNREGRLTWHPRDWGYLRTISISQAEILADIGRPNPWESVRNIIRVTSAPKELNEAGAILWQLRGTPAIADGAEFYIEALFKYEEWQPCGAAVGFDHTVNAEAGGGGADLTGDCPLTYDTDIGEGAKITITNNSGSDGYITLLKTTGDAIYAPSIDIREAADTDSQADYGPKTLEVKSRWIEDTEYAQTLATWLLSEFKDPRDSPIIQIEDRAVEQFYPDLWDRVVLNVPFLGTLGIYRVGHIEHQWLNPTGQSVRTTFKLEPYLQEGIDIVAYQGCQVFTTGETITNNTATDVEWTNEDHDVTGWHSAGTNPERLTVPAGFDGYYALSTTIQWEGHATGDRKVRIQKNGVTLREGIVNDTSEAQIFDQHVRYVDYLVAGDYVTIEVLQTSGGDLDVHSASLLSIDFLGA